MRMSLLIVMLFMNVCFSFDVHAQHPMESIVKSMRWTDELRGYDVELTIHQNRKSVITGKLAEIVPLENRNDGIFSEWVRKLREFKLSDGRFAVASIYGGTTIKTSKGAVSHHEASSSRNAVGDQNGATVLDWEGQGRVNRGDLICGKKGLSCDILAREFDWSKIPLYFTPSLFQLSHRNEALFEKTMELVAAAAPGDIHVEKSRVNKKAVRLYRVKIGGGDPGPNGLRVLKITVSNDGLDSGLVLEIRDLFLKNDQRTQRYESEKQIAEDVGSSVAVEWKQLDNGDKKILVPLHWTLKDKKEVYSQTTTNITAQWRLEEPDPKSLALENLQALCSELQQDVDRTLGREIRKPNNSGRID